MIDVQIDDARNCFVEVGRFVRPCSLLERACNDISSSSRAKGILRLDLHNLDTRPATPSRTFFTVKSGEFDKRGIALNFCPFCGEQIDAPFNSDSQQPQGGEDE